MHIMDGYLPASHAAGWAAATAPFWIHSVRAVNRRMKEHPETKLLLGASGAFAFVLSALKLPSVTGSTSHPTGTGLGAILFGPSVMTLLGTIVLVFQAFLLAHGGVTTLGANAFAMAVVGPWVAYGVYQLVRRVGGSLAVGTFFAATLGDLASYVTTSVQLSLAFPDPTSGFLGAFTKFAGIFAVTQIPIAISEGLLTVLAMNFLIQYSRSELRGLGLVPKETPQ